MAVKKLPTFTEWLARMTTNQTSIGTFARETAQDAAWPTTATTRGAFLSHLIAQDAPAPRLKAFSHAWASYGQAIRRAERLALGAQHAGDLSVTHAPARAQDAQESAQGEQETAQGERAGQETAQDAQGEQDAQDRAQDYDKNHAYASAAQDAQGVVLQVVTAPADEPCQECGGGAPGDNRRWTIPGIGTGVLCQNCLKAVVSQISAALGGAEKKITHA